jgi:hypothetical protein
MKPDELELEELVRPLTEIEVAELLKCVSASGIPLLRGWVRRLAFERERLKQRIKELEGGIGSLLLAPDPTRSYLPGDTIEVGGYRCRIVERTV